MRGHCPRAWRITPFCLLLMSQQATWIQSPLRWSFGFLKILADSGKTILMVTHDNELAERAQRTIRLVDGRI